MSDLSRGPRFALTSSGSWLTATAISFGPQSQFSIMGAHPNPRAQLCYPHCYRHPACSSPHAPHQGLSIHPGLPPLLPHTELLIWAASDDCWCLKLAALSLVFLRTTLEGEGGSGSGGTHPQPDKQ